VAAYQGAGRGVIPPEFDDVGALAAWLTKRARHPPTILIDGYPDAGKTTLAKDLGMHFACSTVHLDDLRQAQIGQYGESYSDALDLSRLVNIAKSRAALIVEGVTVLDMVQHISRRPHLHVYVKRRMKVGLWADETDLLRPDAVDAVCPPTLLRTLVRDYHRRTMPHEACDAIYNRISSK
jgi:hypothetical protein